MRCAWLLLVCLLAGPAPADEQVAAIFAHARRLNPTMSDSQAAVTVTVDATIGPLHEHPTMTGTSYYKREGRYRLDLPDAPSYLKNQPSVFGFNLPELDRYNSRVLEETPRGWRVELTPRNPGNIERLELKIDRPGYTVSEYDTYYSNHGTLTVSLAYVQVQGYQVCSTVHAEFNSPAILLHAVADSRYTGYRFNQGLSDELFAPKAPK